jgi:hypothetical protein
VLVLLDLVEQLAHKDLLDLKDQSELLVQLALPDHKDLPDL